MQMDKYKMYQKVYFVVEKDIPTRIESDHLATH